MSETLLCPVCAKVLESEPNYCPACGGDLRGLTPTANTLSGAVIDERYKVLEKLGEGGMGMVLKVEHIRMGKVLALKLLRPDAALDKGLKARFVQEARVVAKLSHANTVQVFDAGQLSDGALYLAMEYLPGRDLAWHLRARGPMTEEKVISIGTQVLASLEEAHGLGIVHRDIKPANIMLVRRRDRDDQVKLLDFGIARLQEAEGRKSISQTGTDFIGTPAYMSPEQARGDVADQRSDLYSLSCVLFELLCGRQLFTGNNPMQVATQHLTAQVPRLIDVAPNVQVSPSLERVLRKALAKDASDRFPTADAMRVALEQVRREIGGFSGEFTPSPNELTEKMASRADFDSFERTLRFQRVLAPVAFVAILLALMLGGWTWLRTAPKVATSVELEPNDDPKHATRIALGGSVKGTIGAREGDEHDRDLFEVEVPRGGVRLNLEPVRDLNLRLEALQVKGDKLQSLIFLDDAPAGVGERLDGLAVEAGTLYLRVEEGAFLDEPARSPRERDKVPYQLTVESLGEGAWEAEPNDSVKTPQHAALTRSLTGWTGAYVEYPDRTTVNRSGTDFFEVEVAGEGEKVAVLVIPPADGKLLVVDGVAYETWEKLRASGTTPSSRAASPPKLIVVEKEPKLISLSPAGARRMLRVQGAEGTAPGSTYRLAFLTNAENGLAGAIDLARLLESDEALRTKALTLAANAHDGSSAQVAELKSLIH